MLPDERDATYLWDMLEAARDVEQFLVGVTFRQFSADRMRRLAVERQLLVIGEAAKSVSPEYRRSHPEVPRGLIIGQRNILAHEYGEVLVERVWLTGRDIIPDLVRKLATLVHQRPAGGEE